MSKSYEIIIRPILTEKSMKAIEKNNTYVFEVAKDVNKVEIKKAIEEIYKVNVTKVTTLNVLPKYKRMGKYEGYSSSYKKAYVTLQAGQKIDGFNA